MKIGDVFQVKNDHGKYKCIGWNKDGSINAYGGRRGHEKFRDFRPENLRLKAKSQPANDNQSALF